MAIFFLLFGRPENCSAGGGAGTGALRRWMGGGGLAKWASVPRRFVMLFWQFWCKFCRQQRVSWAGMIPPPMVERIVGLFFGSLGIPFIPKCMNLLDHQQHSD